MHLNIYKIAGQFNYIALHTIRPYFFRFLLHDIETYLPYRVAVKQFHLPAYRRRPEYLSSRKYRSKQIYLIIDFQFDVPDHILPGADAQQFPWRLRDLFCLNRV